ncbi:MAG: histidine phosphatase family protein [Pseudomonadales bacterium]|nr:histidine phosphatase family protein [Pseudomonadales bacterium]
MKTLYLLRHAKSSWAQPGCKDIDRPLNQRGLRDAPVMAQRLLDSGAGLDLVVSSPALRTRMTAEIVSKAFQLRPEQLRFEPRVYLSGARHLLQLVQQFDETANAIMLIGHNPALTDFANSLANLAIDNIPTCGLLTLSLAGEHWALADFGEARMIAFDTPGDE